ncbi:helix-turn-helix domain-containing protein [Sphingobacterium siyangense subsp. cladoniae]|uniref:winged helix-turn-helix transcriptional regulator n=1 Tax=Sphingobacterium siyangense TaxID=459529 RepID=UPI0031F81214
MDNQMFDIDKEQKLAINDAMELLSGKWKFCILHNLYIYENMLFKDLQEKAVKISPKVLSKELQELERNLLITRTVNDTKPITVSYTLTDYAKNIQPVIRSLIEFGLVHRRKIKEK